MADYKRKRKRGGRSYTKKRSYIPNLGGGGYSGPRNYFRTHDFRYEREPSAKPPKIETRYEVIERPSTESYRQPTFYRPELDQAALEKSVGHAIERYLRNESEQKRESQYQAETRLDSETPPNLQEAGLEAKALKTGVVAIEEKAPEIDSTEPLVEISQEANPVIGKGAELYDSYELPVNDLELLLVELDASPFEVQPEKSVEAEPGRQQ
jgi:hypothetical protein